MSQPIQTPQALPKSADVVVVGGGAAGIMAAIQAGRRGRSTVLLEKNPRLGLKILISGGGRCNLTTTKSGRELEAEYGARRGRWLRSALRAFQPQQLIAMIEEAGVPLQEEGLEKIFPVSGRAVDVLQCLLRLTEESGTAIVPDTPMLQASRGADGRFAVTTPRGEIHAGSLVLSTGGLSYPKSGSTGDGYGVAGHFGHQLVPTVPHLAPLAVADSWVHDLAGITIDDAVIAVAKKGGSMLCRRRRPILFTHRGLSGPGPMDLSGFVEEAGGGCEVILDFAPDVTAEELSRQWIERARTAGRCSTANALPRPLPERLRQTLTRLADAGGTVAELPKDRRRRLLHLLKDCRVSVDRSLGLAHAEVTRGGIPLDEVDSRTMESRLAPGLYLCGEILDVDGPIGGFNFQAAFATGRLAGLHA